MKSVHCLLFALSLSGVPAAVAAPETLRLPLSGKGPADAIEWDFQITDGRRAGEKAKIPVPSQWEQHGFGNYDYGTVRADSKHKEDGIYQRCFTVPENWRGLRVRIVFDGSMTDTTVTINGQPAGPTHQGGFYRFHFDITDKLKFGAENQLEVLVSKDSSNMSVEKAERDADYWVFGGIYRPVWLEARPPQAIDWTAIDARADGGFRALVHLDGNGAADRLVARVMTKGGEMIGAPLESPVKAGDPVELAGRVPGVRPWSAEAPALYQVEFTLLHNQQVMHRTVERVGFRTLEVLPGQGVFVNGGRITVKGINRHSFRPKSGRALDPQDGIDDVRLIKSMNMNAVRCSHYPPDKAFLEACDEFGLYVVDELCTWQQPTLDTPSARRLVGELIRRDVNHPSILWWANGNEGGWNREVDGDFALWDIQRRPVLHPWALFSGFQTRHYPRWVRLQEDLAGNSLVMPTEFLHGLYDGGHGAGLDDYWHAITSRPIGVGGFLWVLADEGVARTDRNGEIDNWEANAPDGIVGPYHEKEASFLTVKDIFCPVQIWMRRLPPDFDGRIACSNKHDFRNLNTCTFRWQLEKFGKPPAPQQQAGAPDVVARAEGWLKLDLPADWRAWDCLRLTASDREGRELWTWSWPVNDVQTAAAAFLTPKPQTQKGGLRVTGEKTLEVSAGGADFGFDLSNGQLTSIGGSAGLPGLCNGPRLVGPAAVGAPEAVFKVTRQSLESGGLRIEATSRGPFEAFAWTVHPDGLLDLEYRYRIDKPTSFHGLTFDLPESELLGFAWIGQGPERVWANRLRGTRFGSFENTFRKNRPGIDYDYPHRAGFYAGVRQAAIRTKAGTLVVICHQDDTFIRLGTNDEGKHIKLTWPEGDFSVLHAIPAIGTKFQAPEIIGPQSMPQTPPGIVTGKVSLRLSP